MSVSPEVMTELLGLPEPERVDLAQRLLESLREGSAADDLDDEQRERLHRALHRSEADIRAGRVRPAAALIAELRERRTR
ncbi:MAG: hypothetical protein E6J91_18590 [Deltaproteobacteria bacterium]|nr:MAG: hypothetical protein E6J91_18590 [Deltaproteobacteria bacterium]